MRNGLPALSALASQERATSNDSESELVVQGAALDAAELELAELEAVFSNREAPTPPPRPHTVSPPTGSATPSAQPTELEISPSQRQARQLPGEAALTLSTVPATNVGTNPSEQVRS